MGSIQNDFAISLRSWPLNSQDSSGSLPSVIQRIDEQRGGFRNITEDGLRQEIAEEEAAAAVGGADVSSDEEEEEEPDRLKVLMDAKTVMLQNIHAAHMHAAQALDFMSLLLSKDMPVQASATINPELRDAVPMGSLGMDKLSASRYTDVQKQDNKRVAKAWKLQSLDKAVDSILESATRLEKEIEKETKYWEQILSVNDAGWSVCKLPNDKHTLGVRFGFTESAPAFKNRSLAALRRNPDGSISLDTGPESAEPQALRVRIRDSSAEYVGSSTLPLPLPEDVSIDAIILQARNTIFDAELWQEINREARSLGAYGVRANDENVTFILTSSKTVVIDLVDLEDTDTSPSHANDKMAEGISLALHILLSIAHRQKYRKRTQVPPPISNQKPNASPYNLIRHVLTGLNHHYAITSIHSLFHPLCAALRAAKISPEPTYDVVSTPLNTEMFKNHSATEIAVISLTDRLESITNFKITESTTLTVRTATATYPVCATTHSVTISPGSELQVTCKAPLPLTTWRMASEYIIYATACALASQYASDESNSWESSPSPDAICRETIDGQEIQLQFKVEYQSGIAELRVQWGNIVAPSRHTPAGEASPPRGEGAYEWKSGKATKGGEWEDGEGEVVRSLQDVVDEAGRS